MFNYALSAVIAFLVFGVIFNIYKNVKQLDLDQDELLWCWIVILIASLFWFFAVPIGLVIIITIVLKFITDKISQLILKVIKK